MTRGRWRLASLSRRAIKVGATPRRHSSCLLDFVFGTLGKHRVSAVTDAENSAAASLFKRLGFRQEAHFVEHRWYQGYRDSELFLVC